MKNVHFILQSAGSHVFKDVLTMVRDNYVVTQGDIDAVEENWKTQLGNPVIVINYYTVDASYSSSF